MPKLADMTPLERKCARLSIMGMALQAVREITGTGNLGEDDYAAVLNKLYRSMLAAIESD